MNRRTFLKSLGIVCGAAVVCPGELLKDEPVEVKPGWYDVQIFSEADRIKYRQNIIIKVRQQGITTCIINNKSAPFTIGTYDENIQTLHRSNPSRS